MVCKWNWKSKTLKEEKHSQLSQLQEDVFLENRICKYSWKLVGLVSFWALWEPNKWMDKWDNKVITDCSVVKVVFFPQGKQP